MPNKIKSLAQLGLMQAAAHGRSDKVPQSVAKEMLATQTTPASKLPAKVKPKKQQRYY